MSVSNGEPESLGTGVAAVTATNFPTMLRAAPVLAAAANVNIYRLRELMPESKFSELPHGGLDRRSPGVMPSLRQTVISRNHAHGGGSAAPVNRRHQRPEGPGR